MFLILRREGFVNKNGNNCGASSKDYKSFFSRFIEAIEIAASEHKYKLIICQTRYLPEKEMEYLQLLSTKQVDGIILCSLENPWEDVEPYLQHGPIVLCNEYIEEANIPTVKFDHAQGAYIAAKHVLDQGYRNLIFAW